jgi:hypothetical protein
VVPGIDSVVLQVARIIEAVLLKLVRLAESVLLQLLCVLVPLGVILVPRAGVVGEAAGVMNASLAAATKSGISGAIEIAAIAKPRPTERLAVKPAEAAGAVEGTTAEPTETAKATVEAAESAAKRYRLFSADHEARHRASS